MDERARTAREERRRQRARRRRSIRDWAAQLAPLYVAARARGDAAMAARHEALLRRVEEELAALDRLDADEGETPDP